MMNDEQKKDRRLFPLFIIPIHCSFPVFLLFIIHHS